MTGFVDVPGSFKFSGSQRRYVELSQKGESLILWTAMIDALARLEYPLHIRQTNGST